MSGKAEILKEEFTFAFEALENTLEGLDEEEFTYRLTETSNNIQGILTHLSIITNLNIPSIIQGQQYWTPEDKVIDPIDPEYSLQKLVDEIRKGKEKILEGLARLSEDDLREEIPLMAGPYPRKIGLFAYLGEIFHHRGQIAFIRGTIKRSREHECSKLAMVRRGDRVCSRQV